MGTPPLAVALAAARWSRRDRPKARAEERLQWLLQKGCGTAPLAVARAAACRGRLCRPSSRAEARLQGLPPKEMGTAPLAVALAAARRLGQLQPHQARTSSMGQERQMAAAAGGQCYGGEGA